jgi:hypothetical protein
VDYYQGADFPQQMQGMQGYFSRFPENGNTALTMRLIASFRFSLSLLSEPDLHIDSDDERLRYVLAVVKHLDGAIFTPSSLRDAAGRVLYGTSDPDPAAVMPRILKEVPSGPRDQLPRSQGGTQPDPDDPARPAAARVARRACALAAVCGRALLEQEDPADPGVEETRRRIETWVNDIGIADELEPDEWKILQLPLGAPPRQDAVNATWRLEGLGVLAWALQRFDLPPHDELVNPAQLLRSMGILDVDAARALIAGPALRSRGEVEAMGHRLFAVHWRARSFRIRPQAMNFAEFAKTAWFGPLDVTELRMIGGDLAVGDVAIGDAEPDRVGALESSAMERHLAINWLNGYSVIYSETDIST